jgi:hypothetical protein
MCVTRPVGTRGGCGEGWGPGACPAGSAIQWGFRGANRSHPNQDKHQAHSSTPPRPLSLQDAGGHFLSFPYWVVTIHQDTQRDCCKIATVNEMASQGRLVRSLSTRRTAARISWLRSPVMAESGPIQLLISVVSVSAWCQPMRLRCSSLLPLTIRLSRMETWPCIPPGKPQAIRSNCIAIQREVMTGT